VAAITGGRTFSIGTMLREVGNEMREAISGTTAVGAEEKEEEEGRETREGIRST
jgi:hypothetical protein